jgi:hypothetical protein
MSATDVKKDLDTIKAGVMQLIAVGEAKKLRVPADDDERKPEKGEKGNKKSKNHVADQIAAIQAEAAEMEQLMNEQVPAMIEAGFRLIGGIFVNLQRIADAIEDQHGAS